MDSAVAERSLRMWLVRGAHGMTGSPRLLLARPPAGARRTERPNGMPRRPR